MNKSISHGTVEQYPITTTSYKKIIRRNDHQIILCHFRWQIKSWRYKVVIISTFLAKNRPETFSAPSRLTIVDYTHPYWWPARSDIRLWTGYIPCIHSTVASYWTHKSMFGSRWCHRLQRENVFDKCKKEVNQLTIESILR